MVSVNDPWVRRLIQLLDGTRTVPEMTVALLDSYLAGDLPEMVFIDSSLPEGEQEIDIKTLPKDNVLEKLAIRIREILCSLLENGVLIG